MGNTYRLYVMSKKVYEVILGIISYPLDAAYIMKKKRSLLKSAKAQSGLVAKKIALVGGSTIGDIKTVLELFLCDNGIAPEFYEGGYNSFFEDVVFDDGSLKAFAPDIIYVHTSVRNVKFPDFTATGEEVTVFAKQQFSRFEAVLNAAKQMGCTVIQNNFELPPYRPAGNAEARFAGGNVRFVQVLNDLLFSYAAENKHVYINDINYLSAQLGLDRWHDETMYYAYKYVLTPECIPYLCDSITAIVRAIYGKSKKAVILDLDNTLWGGVIGDDGVQGIEIGNESPLGMAHLELCRFALRLKQQGIMLSVCSKNERDTALSGFEREEMPLSVDDFVSFTANWEPKSENIKAIIQQMNISADAAVFVDDNPAERHIVEGQVSGITVPLLSEPETYVKTLNRLNVFEVAQLTGDDGKRTEFIKANAQREQAQSSFADYDEYLKSLDMSAVMSPVTPQNIARVTQLVNKTNQFNLTTKRYTEAEVEQLMNNKDNITLCATLSDRFGENGIVSVLFAKVDGDVCEVELFVMSCRVFKRRLETAVMQELIEQAVKCGVKTIKGCFIPTAKNAPCASYYSEFGFSETNEQDGTQYFELATDNYRQQQTHIIIKRS